MTIKDQFKKIRENWLIILVLFILVILPGMMSGMLNAVSYRMTASDNSYAESKSIGASRGYGPAYSPTGDFAPEEAERKITKSAGITTEVERGKYHEEEARMKSLVTSSGSFLLNENVNNYGTNQDSYFNGYYLIKVETAKFDSVLSQLKEIGEVKSFTQGKEDITAQYRNAQVELDAEKARLARYEQMLLDAKTVTEKMEISDRIYDRETRIKYMEEAMDNVNLQIDYSTVSFYMQEKRSMFANVSLVRFADLLRNMVESFNTLLTLMFVLVPWAVAGTVIFLIVKLAGRKNA